MPEHARYDMDQFLQRLQKLQEEATKKAVSESKRSKIIKGIKDIRNAVAVNEIEPGQLKRGKGVKRSGISESNIVKGRRPRKQTKRDEVIADSALEAATSVPENAMVELSGKNNDVDNRSEFVGKPVRKLLKGDVVSIDTKQFDGDVPGSYSAGKPARTFGRVQRKSRKRGVYLVRWDADDTNPAQDFECHWSHMVLEIPKVSVETILTVLGDTTELKTRPEDQEGNWPSNFFEALVRSDWREWVSAVKKEIDGWNLNEATRVVKFEDVKPGARCIPMGELFTIKRDGRYKFRQIAFGNLLRPGKDFGETFASTVSADGMRWFFALACSTNLQIYGWDATTGYLQAELKIPVYAFLPSHHEYSELPMEELAVFREQLLKLIDEEGPQGLKRFVADHRRATRKNPDKVLELLKSVYGIPSAGNTFAMLMRSTHIEKCGVHQTETDPSIYIKIVTEPVNADEAENRNREVQYVGANGSEKVHCADGTCVEFLVIIIWTDDVRYFGTEELRLQYEKDIKENLRVEFEGPSTSFVSCDFVQDFENKTLEVTQCKYWEKCVQRNSDLWENGIPESRATPMTPADATFLTLPVSDQDFEEAKHLEFPQLLGQIQFPSVYTKLEMRFAMSLLSRQRAKWSKKAFQILVKALEYGYASRQIGLLYSCGLDQHGVNKLYAYADSNFAVPRSQGCRVTMMNGCAISMTSKRHTTTDTSTCEAEATEFFLCTRDVERLRNLMGEVGLFQQEPTVIYQDNQPAIQVMMNRGSLPNRSKAMDICVLAARNKIGDLKVLPVYVRTLEMLADIGTKALDEKQFVFLRDLMNGYAVVRACNPEADLPSIIISAAELGMTSEDDLN